jgi:hypothetical protein
MMAVSTLEAVGTTPLIELDAVCPAGGARVLVRWVTSTVVFPVMLTAILLENYNIQVFYCECNPVVL